MSRVDIIEISIVYDINKKDEEYEEDEENEEDEEYE